MNRSTRLGGLMLVIIALIAGGAAAIAAGTQPQMKSTSPAAGTSVQSAPTVSATYDQALHETSTLIVTDSSGVAIAGTTTFTSSGGTAVLDTIVFTPSSPLTPAGSPYTATATVTNDTDDQEAVTTWSFSVDTTAPQAPAIDSVDGDSDSPATGSDPTPTIVVSGVVAGDTVRILDGAAEGRSAVVPSGATTITFNAAPTDDDIVLADGDHRLTATSADPAGNVSTASVEFLYTLDTSKPDAPVIASVNGDSTSPATGTDPTPTIVVSGVMAGDTVRILEGTTVLGTKVVPAPVVPGPTSITFNSGSASTDVTVADGAHTLTADAVDAAGNVSPPSKEFVYTLDTGAPATPTIASVNGDNASPAVGGDLTPTIVVSGVMAGDTVRILEGTTVKGAKVVPASATSVTFNEAELATEVVLTGDGDHTLTATSTDPEGNASPASSGFVYTLDTGLTSPTLVSTSPADDSTVRPPATVSATYGERLDPPDRSTLSLTNGQGNSVGGTVALSADAKTIIFTPTSTLTEAGNVYTARAVVRDGNGNETTSTWTFTVDTTAPVAPTIASVDGRAISPAAGTDSTPTIVVSGVSAGDTVRILDGSTARGTKVVPAGSTSVTFNAAPADADVVLSDDGSHSLTATSTDPYGNASAASAAFVYALTTSFPGEFHGITPARILDTRDGTGGFSARVRQGATIAVPVAGKGGVPATGVSAVVLNVTATSPTTVSYLTVFPAGTTRPVASNLNFVPGQTVPNLVVAKVGADGKVAVYNNAGSTHVIFDVMGWFSDATGPEGATFTPLSPARILDTRDGTGGFSAPVASAGTISPKVTGVGGAPATGVSAVVLNVTATAPTAGSYLTVFPAGTTRPLASNLNFVPGQTVPNLVIAKVGADGKVSVYNNLGTTHVIFDVVGWFGTGGDAGGHYTSLSPTRILDTRAGTGGFSAPVASAGTISPKVTGVGGVPATGVSAVVLNVTATAPTAVSYLTVFPSGTSRPLASNLNFVPGQTVPNLVMAKVGDDGKVSVYNNVGTTHVIFDVVGWYSQ